MPEFAGRDFLAAAHNHLVLRHAIFIAWPIEAVEERTNAHDVAQAPKQRRGAAIARGGIDRAKLRGNRQRCHFALRLCRLRAADAAAVACNEDAGDIEFAPLIGDGRKAQLRIIPLMRCPQRLRELRIRRHALVQQDDVGFDPMRHAPRRKMQRTCALASVFVDTALHAQIVSGFVHRHACFAQGPHQLQALAQVRPCAQRGQHVPLGAPAVVVARGIDERADRYASAYVLPSE